MGGKPFTVVVVGAGYGGSVLAGRLARRAKNNVRVVLIDRAPELVQRIRLHQFVAGQEVPSLDYENLFEGSGVEFRRASVQRIDPQAKRVYFDDDSIAYDRLVLANGSGDSRALVPGAAEHAHAIATPAAALKLKQRFDALQAGAEVVVCGGGATAIETVTELADARPDLHFTIVSAGRIGEVWSEKGREHVLRALRSRRVRIVERTRVTRVERSRVVTEAGEPLWFDLAIWAASFVPSPLARESGFAVRPDGQLAVDATLRSISHPDVYGVGDTAGVETLDGGVKIRMACATALPMGAHVADNLYREATGRVPRRFRFGYQVQCISLGRRDGLLQFVRHDDSPIDGSLRGVWGAIAKELICRYTIWMVRAEVRGIRAISWPQPSAMPTRKEQALPQW